MPDASGWGVRAAHLSRPTVIASLWRSRRGVSRPLANRPAGWLQMARHAGRRGQVGVMSVSADVRSPRAKSCHPVQDEPPASVAEPEPGEVDAPSVCHGPGDYADQLTFDAARRARYLTPAAA